MTVDAGKGFWQVCLNEDSSKLTSFWTPFGKFRWLRMPFGIKPAMQIYQRKQSAVLQGLEGVAAIADDILIYGKGKNMTEAIKDHNNKLEKLLHKCRKSNLKLNKEKINLCMQEVKYYGHILTNEGVKPDPAKISAIQNMKVPADKAELSRFMGMITYLSQYLPKLSEKAEPLRKLTHLEEDFIWTSQQEESCKQLKKMVTTAPLLKYYAVNQAVTITILNTLWAIH